MQYEIGDIQANTQVSQPNITPFQASFAPEPLQSPTYKHISHSTSFMDKDSSLQPSPHRNSRSFRDIPCAISLPVELRLLHDFINNLPTRSPSPFKVDIFVESPEQKRKLVEGSVFLKERNEYDENGVLMRHVENSMVYDKPPEYRAHCVLVGSSKIKGQSGQAPVDVPCSVWTRKYPVGWDGIHLNEAGELVNYEYQQRKRNIVWAYSAAACVILKGAETSIECVVPEKVVEFNDVQIDLEPGWEDVVYALRDQCLRLVQGDVTINRRQISGKEYSFSRFPHPQQLLSPQVLPPQMSPQHALQQPVIPQQIYRKQQTIETQPPPRNSPRRTVSKTPRKCKKGQDANPLQQIYSNQEVASHRTKQSARPRIVPAFTSGNNVTPPNSRNKNRAVIPRRERESEQSQFRLPLGWVGGPILPGCGHPYQEGRGSLSTQEAVEARRQDSKARLPSQAVQLSAKQGLKNNDGSPLQAKQPQSKRKRVSAEEPPTLTKEVQEPSGRSGYAIVAESLPSIIKYGTTRKNSISNLSPAKKTSARKTGVNKTAAIQTPTGKTPAFETTPPTTAAIKIPARKRGWDHPQGKLNPSSEVRDDSSASIVSSETEDGMQSNSSERQTKFRLAPPSNESTGFGAPKVIGANYFEPPVQSGHLLPFDPSRRFQSQKAEMRLPLPGHGFATKATNQLQMSTPIRNSPQMSDLFDPYGSLGVNLHPQASQIYHQIRDIDIEQIYLLRTCPNASVNPAGYMQFQAQIEELGKMREQLSSMIPAQPDSMYPMAWNNSIQPNNKMCPPHQETGQLDSNTRIFLTKPNNGFQNDSCQISSIQQNNRSFQAHSLMSGPRWCNNPEKSSILDNNLAPATLPFALPGTFQQEAEVTGALPIGSANPNSDSGESPVNEIQSITALTPQISSRTQLALADFPEDRVHRARSSVKWTLQKSLHKFSTDSSLAGQQNGDD
jgi:hypothetical protein